ncbi:hypothetical protein GCM10017788_79410 [Amycolatopsis acidiphila]|nr:hypothetical protein GCM10017788_79410 [Amycolatopsis acidiphila]
MYCWGQLVRVNGVSHDFLSANGEENDRLGSRFATLVRTYRREAGLTQRELAMRAGLSVAALRDFEQGRRGRPRANSLAALVGALGLDPEQAIDLAKAAAPSRSRERGVLQAGAEPAQIPASIPERGLWVSVLGPLEVWRDRTALALGPFTRRAVLALLATEPGALVHRDTIVDVLWAQSPPPSAVSLIQAHVSRLRRLLEPAGLPPREDGVIVSEGGAYRLRLPQNALDLQAFRAFAVRADGASVRGDLRQACEFYERAVELWRGDPLAHLDLVRGHPGVDALGRELVAVLLRYAELACELGEYERVLPRLHSVAAAEPLNELVHARLLIALAASGQQAEALWLYEDLRRRLDRELGVYPGDELATAHLRVLRGEFSGTGGTRVCGFRTVQRPIAVRYVVPWQLPAAPRRFTGRKRELAALSGLPDQRTGGAAICALVGMVGVGKTALAVEWAHRMAEDFPDGHLFVDLRGFGPSGNSLAPGDAVYGFLHALGVPPGRLPDDAEEQAKLYRSLLAHRRLLIVLDNARDAGQVRPLLPGAGKCMVLVTSRNRLTGLAATHGAQLVEVGPLDAAEARELLASGLGAERARTECGEVAELAERCLRLPLALRNAAARVAAFPGLPLSALTASMRGGRQDWLNSLETGDPVSSVRAVLSWSQSALSPGAARLFRLLALHPGPDVTVGAAASLAEVSCQDAHAALTELYDDCLLTQRILGRFAFHDLVQAYAAEQVLEHDDEAGRTAAVRRLLDHYLHLTAAAVRAMYPQQPRLALGAPLPGVVTVDEFSGPMGAGEWFEAEQEVLFGLVELAAGSGSTHAWQLPWLVRRFELGDGQLRRLAGA